jgi:DNA-binding transcriptional regulator YhcF (GntR family)
MRALVIGTVASFKECWTFRRNLAKHVGCSVRTVQRALTQARSEGLIRVQRAKKTDIPPQWEHGPVTCGWSHRWVCGWGQAGEKVKQAVEQAKARWIVRTATNALATSAKPTGSSASRETTRTPVAARPEYQRRSWTATELDAELDRLARLQKPPPS